MPSNNIIKRRYVTPKHPTSFGGITKLGNFYGIKTSRTKRILKGVKSYSLHRETKKPKYRNCYFIYQLRQQIQADLVDVNALAKENDEFKYLLTAIDMFSRKLVCIPMKNKSAREASAAVGRMIRIMKPKQLFTDAGKEFVNATVANLLRINEIEHMIAASDMKCSGVERVNKTLQRKLYQYMTENNTDRYIDILPDIVSSYNNSKHETIALTPEEAEQPENVLQVRDELNKWYTHIVRMQKKPSFKKGDIVRISRLKDKFLRSYKEQNKAELYEIIDVKTRMPIPMYTLKSLEKLDVLEGGFYSNELTHFDPETWEIDVSKPLKKRVHKGERQVLARWVGFHKSYFSWIPASQLEKFKTKA